MRTEPADSRRGSDRSSLPPDAYAYTKVDDTEAYPHMRMSPRAGLPSQRLAGGSARSFSSMSDVNKGRSPPAGRLRSPRASPLAPGLSTTTQRRAPDLGASRWGGGGGDRPLLSGLGLPGPSAAAGRLSPSRSAGRMSPTASHGGMLPPAAFLPPNPLPLPTTQQHFGHSRAPPAVPSSPTGGWRGPNSYPSGGGGGGGPSQPTAAPVYITVGSAGDPVFEGGGGGGVPEGGGGGGGGGAPTTPAAGQHPASQPPHFSGTPWFPGGGGAAEGPAAPSLTPGGGRGAAVPLIPVPSPRVPAALVPGGVGGGDVRGARPYRGLTSTAHPETLRVLKKTGVPDHDPGVLALRVVQPVWWGQNTPPLAEWRDAGGSGGSRQATQQQQHTAAAPYPQHDHPPLGALPVATELGDGESIPPSPGSEMLAEEAAPPSAHLGGDTTAAEVIRQLFHVKGLGEDHAHAMSPWLDNPTLLSAIDKHLSHQVPLTRYGLRTDPEERWFLIVSFADREKRMVPWLIWLEYSPNGDADMRDRCPLDSLISFKAGKWCSDSPGFAPHVRPNGILSAANNVVTDTPREVVASELQGCMVLGFKKRTLELHCSSRDDWMSLVKVFKSIVQINGEARKQAEARAGVPSAARHHSQPVNQAASQQPHLEPTNLQLDSRPPRRKSSVPVTGRI